MRRSDKMSVSALGEWESAVISCSIALAWSLHSSVAMRDRIFIYAFAIVTLIGGVSAAADAVVFTDEERLEDFVEAVTGDVASDRIDNALEWVDPDREAVEVSQGREVRRYEDGESVELAVHARELLAPFEGNHAVLLQDSIDIEGERARVTVRMRTGDGVLNVRFDMVRHEDGWFVRRVRAS